MCSDYKMNCACGLNTASFLFKEDVMPVEVLERLYCPKCSPGMPFQRESMIEDNGWIIKYDMEIAGFAGRELPLSELTPEYLFDKGYCTWRGVYPTDHIDSVKEREELVKLSKIDPKEYLKEMKRWAIERQERLAAEGWRKANEK